MCRKQIFIRNTLFMSVRYFPTGVQILTGGSDRKIAYWEVFDGSLIRELEGSAINALDISPDGLMFLSGDNDQILKLWKYNEGYPTHVGIGHAGVITAVRFSPNGQFIVSTSGSGDIFIWKCPFDVAYKEKGEGDRASSISKLTTPKESSVSGKKIEEAIKDINAKPELCPGIVSEVDARDVGDMNMVTKALKTMHVRDRCVCPKSKMDK